MPRRTALPVAEAKLAFLVALRRGALVVEAARGTGVAVWSFYRWRRRDPLFDAAWTMAAAASVWAEQTGADGRVRRRRTKRRVRFGPAERSAFLDRLPEDCNTEAAARDRGFNPCTVRRHIVRDPGFARDNRAALSRGYDRLIREDEERRAARAGRLSERLEPVHVPPPADFDALERLLRRYGRPDGSIGPRRVCRPAARNVWTFEQAIVALDRALDNLGVRGGGGDEAGGG